MRQWKEINLKSANPSQMKKMAEVLFLIFFCWVVPGVTQTSQKKSSGQPVVQKAKAKADSKANSTVQAKLPSKKSGERAPAAATSLELELEGAAASPSLANTKEVEVDKDIPKSEKMKRTVSFDYHSWFENLNFNPTTGSQSGIKSVYYGFALVYDVTKYLNDWGWGAQVGFGQGLAVGDGDAGTYIQKRVAWNYLRGGGRIFKRLNGRTDLGLTLLALRENISWPANGGIVIPGPNPFFSLFIEARWRMTRQWELIQAIGNSTNNAGASLRLGFGYTF